MSKIPTAEEFIKDLQNEQGEQEYTLLYKIDVPEKMIEFAKLHICNCKLQILEKLPDTLSTEVYDIIRNAYSLDNIK